MSEEKDILRLDPGSQQDIACRFLERLEVALNNKKVDGLLIMDFEAKALLDWVCALEAEILMLREYQI